MGLNHCIGKRNFTFRPTSRPDQEARLHAQHVCNESYASPLTVINSNVTISFAPVSISTVSYPPPVMASSRSRFSAKSHTNTWSNSIPNVRRACRHSSVGLKNRTIIPLRPSAFLQADKTSGAGCNATKAAFGAIAPPCSAVCATCTGELNA